MKDDSWIQTYTGQRFHPLDPDPATVSIIDIGHSLSCVCRFAGHCSTFYSVAQHSVLVARAVPRKFALLGLLHDAAEAYTGDIARPWKKRLVVNDGVGGSSMTSFATHENILLGAIFTALGVSTPLKAWEVVHAADFCLLATEVRDLMGLRSPEDWPNTFTVVNYKPMPYTIKPQTPKRAKAEFLALYEELKAQ